MLIGLLPLLWAHGSGADVMKRIAAPMIGGLVTSAFLTLEIIPVIYTYWRYEQLRWRLAIEVAPEHARRLAQFHATFATLFVADVALGVIHILVRPVPSWWSVAAAALQIASATATVLYLLARSLVVRDAAKPRPIVATGQRITEGDETT
jgi:hypothetical protein